jgi:excisionase family DNA binding protein
MSNYAYAPMREREKIAQPPIVPAVVNGTLHNPMFAEQLTELAVQQNEILNKKEAAKVLRISVRTADEWMKKGILPFIKMPTGAVRLRRSQLLGLMDRYAVSTGGVA